MYKTEIIIALIAVTLINGNAAFSTESGAKERARGDVLALRGNYDEALTKFDEAIKLDPKSAQAFSHRAATLVNLGKYQEALADCNTAIKLDPKYVQAHVLRGLIYKQLGKPRKEIQDMRLAKKLIKSTASTQ